MAGIIYLLQDGADLVAMTEMDYDSEDLLQELLARYPDLLAGDQIDSSQPRRWLLIRREAPIPAEQGGAGWWAVDHLFLDQDGVPTLVEVKRSSDTRSRREVVGQMLDYAANAVAYWPVEGIRATFEANCRARDREPEQILAEFLGPDADQEQFWHRAKTNLQAGRVRLIFVADQIPRELQRIVEFLSRQMDPAQVLAVEVKQYEGQGLKTLVPRVVGRLPDNGTDSAQKRRWDENSFLREVELKRGTAEAQIVRRIIGWARERNLRPSWGRGKHDGSFYPMVDHGGMSHSLFGLWTSGTAQIQFGVMRSRPPFDSEARRMELLDRLNQIPGVALPAEAITKYPSIRLSSFGNSETLAQFLDVFDWAVGVIRGS